MLSSVKKWFPIIFLTVALFGGFAGFGFAAQTQATNAFARAVALGDEDCIDGCVLPDPGVVRNSGSDDEITLPIEDEISILPIEEEVTLYDSTDCIDGCILPDCPGCPPEKPKVMGGFDGSATAEPNEGFPEILPVPECGEDEICILPVPEEEITLPVETTDINSAVDCPDGCMLPDPGPKPGPKAPYRP